jgi:ribosome-associated protein
VTPSRGMVRLTPGWPGATAAGGRRTATDEERRAVPATERARELALAAAQAAADKKAQDIVILDVADQLVITDAFLIASAPNERQVLAIVDAIEERLLDLPEKAKPVRREGERAGRWVLLDYVDIVVHVQHTEEREFYALDRLWKDVPTIPFVDRDLVSGDPGRVAG